MLLDELVRRSLERAVGADQVSTDPCDLEPYAYDFTGVAPCTPAAVVKPDSVDELSEAVAVLSRARVPFMPVAGGQNNSGLAIPKGTDTVVIDLKRMNRILEIDEGMRYAVVEPGVTTGQLHEALSARGFWTGYPQAPAHAATIVANTLLSGWGQAPLRFGNQAELINSLEAVLPDGTVARVGASAVSDHWCGRGSLPDLVGLFVGWHGATGIVSKLALKIWRRPTHFDSVCYRLPGRPGPGLIDLVQDLLDVDVLDDLTCLVQGDFGATGAHSIESRLLMKVSAMSDDLLAAKQYALRAVTDSYRAAGVEMEAVALSREERVRAFSGAGTIGHESGGDKSDGTIAEAAVYAFAPLVNVPEMLEAARVIFDKYGLSFVFRFQLFAGSRYVKVNLRRALRGDVVSDQADAEGFVADAVAALVTAGGTICRAPAWAKRYQYDQGDPGFTELLWKIKSALDPHLVAARGNLGLSASV